MLVFRHAADNIGGGIRWGRISNYDRHADRLHMDGCKQRDVVVHHIGHKRIRRRLGGLQRVGQHRGRAERNADRRGPDGNRIPTIGVLLLFGEPVDNLRRRHRIYGVFGVSHRVGRMCMDGAEQCLVDFDCLGRQWHWERQHHNRSRGK